MNIRRITYLAIALLALVFASCDNGYDCNLNNIAYNRIGFYSINGDSISEGYNLQEELMVSLMVNGREAIATDDGQGVTGMQLPMSHINECDTVLFRYGGEFADTLYISHKNIQFYQSMECGTIMYHNINGIEYTRNLIDSVAVVNKFVNFDDNENIKVYFVE